jgi:membrane protease YdiL (CAAX protease family)
MRSLWQKKSTLSFFAIYAFLKTAFIRFVYSAPILICLGLTLLFLEFIIPSEYFILFNQSYNGKTLPCLVFFIFATILFFFLLPTLLCTFFYKEKLTHIGFALPVKKIETAILMLLALLLMVPIILWLAKQHSFQHYYSFNKPSTAKLAFLILVIFPIYYICEEFFFRGFLLINLWKRMRWHSLWITDILFTFAHIAKPLLEIVIALPAGIILALLTLRLKSIYPAMVVHYVLGVTMILAVNGII